jgi:hypothetical protein
MIRYQLQDGSEVTLANHTLEEWREKQALHQIRLGCSEDFVKKTEKHYTEAK